MRVSFRVPSKMQLLLQDVIHLKGREIQLEMLQNLLNVGYQGPLTVKFPVCASMTLLACGLKGSHLKLYTETSLNNCFYRTVPR